MDILSLFLTVPYILLIAIEMIKSPYPMKPKTRKILLCIFAGIYATFLWLIFKQHGEFFRNLRELCIPILAVLYLFLICWHLHYFYCKSKDGYRKVWFKVILFILIPFLALLFKQEADLEPLVMQGDIMD